MFLGDYQHTLDAKGRVSLPAKFRAQMAGRIVVAKGLEHSLYVFTAEAYEKFMADLLAKSDFDPTIRKVRRFFTSGADELELDSAGRVSLPPKLREWAELKKDVRVTGVGDRIEIWDSELWDQYNGETADDIDTLSQELSKAGLL